MKSLERKMIAYSAVTTLSIVLVHAMAMLLRKNITPSAPPAAYELVWATIIVMIVSLLTSQFWKSSLHRFIGSIAMSVAVAAIYYFIDNTLLVSMISVLLVCPIAVFMADTLAVRLPERLDGAYSRMPVKSLLWMLLALLMVTQTARLSSWVADSNQVWQVTTDHPLFAGHMCMVAYIYAADLNRQGVENVYDQSLYPGMNRDVEVNTTIKNLQPEDPYQYPPQFLLLPRLAIALTSDFEIIKIFWLFLQVLFFGFIAWSVARFIGGDVGLIAAMLIPLIWISFPVLANVQYGQFHMMSILMAVAGMMWFAREKYFIGGASLAFAILSKAAPAILLIYLLARRRWKEAGWTLALCAVFSLLALAVVGTKPFVAFFTYQLPSLQSGSAFDFAAVWPELTDLIVAGNQSPFAFIFKLDALGVPGMTLGLAKITHMIYALIVVVLAFVVSRFEGSQYKQLLIWLALLNLAAMISKGAWGDYIPIGTIWLMTFMVKEMWSTTAKKLLMATMWVFMFLSLGVLPLPGLDNPSLFISLAGIGMLLTIGFNFWVIFKQKEFAEVVVSE